MGRLSRGLHQAFHHQSNVAVIYDNRIEQERVISKDPGLKST
jgi:hypothetical protein